MDKLIKFQDIQDLPLVKVAEVCNSIQTFQELYHSELPTLRYCAEKYGKAEIEAVLCLKITSILEFFNLKRSMNESQIDLTASIILEKYHWLTLWDINKVFQGVMMGEYTDRDSKLYSAIDGTIIMEWFRKYEFQRWEEMEQASIEAHIARKNNKTIFAPEIALRIKNILGPKADKEAIRQPSLQPSDIEQEGWTEFDRLNKEQDKKLPGTNIPMVEVEGWHYTQDQFTSYYFKKKMDDLTNTPID